ncbi:MAG TPA: hypothetical protein VJN64_04915 [Terriglobales bacterium]|nr:hypothetical protein [Terriglobales bacterium]
MSDSCPDCKTHVATLSKVREMLEGYGEMLQEYKDAIYAMKKIAGFLLLHSQAHRFILVADGAASPDILKLLREDIEHGPLSDKAKEYALTILSGAEMSWKLTLETSKGAKPQ